jgi:aldehyde dehydrogenase (NAD+)
VSELARAELAGSVVGASYVRPRALGVLALITPVMLPIATAHAQLIAAIVAGNTVVWKPSSLVAASAQIYIEALHAAGVPAGVVNLVHGTARVGRRLIAHAGVDGVVFAGARDHAREVRRATCDRIDLPVLLHAGAKNIAIVLEGADLAHAASQIATCAMLSSGQRATAIGRVVVAAPLIEPLGEALAREMKRLATTPGFAGPIVSSERFDRYFARIRAAAADGARVVLRPESRPDSLVAGPSIHAAEGADRAALAGYLSDELFGPDLALEPVADLEEALARLRGHPANVAAVFSASDDELARAGRALDAGAVLANHAPIAMSGRLSFAARGMANRGALAVLALTRRAAWVSAGPADVGLPGWATSDDTRAADPPVAAAPAAGGAQ